MLASRVIRCHQMSMGKRIRMGKWRPDRQKNKMTCRAEGAEVPVFTWNGYLSAADCYGKPGNPCNTPGLWQKKRVWWNMTHASRRSQLVPIIFPSNQKRSTSVFPKWIFSDFSRIENSFGKPMAWTGGQDGFDLSLIIGVTVSLARQYFMNGNRGFIKQAIEPAGFFVKNSRNKVNSKDFNYIK